MRSVLQSAVGKFVILGGLLLAVSGYAVLAARQFLAAHFSARGDLRALQLAIRLEPGDAEYRYLLGRYFWFVERSAGAAVEPYQSAIRLNPFEERAWFDLAAVYQYAGDSARQEDALRHAIEEDPSTPDAAWEAANLYLVQGETDKALTEFRVVLANDPYRPPSALAMCWRIQPDIEALLQNVVPAQTSVYSAFLEFLISKKEASAAAKVWAAMAQLGEPVERRYVFSYMTFLFRENQVDQARLVWQQAGNLSRLAAYQPTPGNLIVNGDFTLDVINGGFDWTYRQSEDVSLALDPSQPHTGNRTLRMVLDSRALDDMGLQHFIAVQPSTAYEFSANFRAEDMEGAGGPRFVLQDAYSGNVFLASDTLQDGGFWKSVTGEFTTAADTKLLLLRLQRFPAGSPIKGKVWIDAVRLVAKQDFPGGGTQ